MYEILGKIELAPVVTKMVVNAPHIAQKAKPGQFIILRVCETGERIPLTIFQSNPKNGTITIIFQKVGKTTKHLGTLNVNGHLQDLVGPLGKPTHVEKLGNVVSISGGVGTAIGYPVTKAFKDAGNYIISILGARSSNLLLLEDELNKISDEFHITTDDGTKGQKGFVSDVLKQLIADSRKINLVIAVGPLPMMRVICDVTRPHNIKTLVSLDSIMMDGTGMCGVCRVSVGGETKFTCVDGPDFDGHLVDWDVLKARKTTYLEEEKTSNDKFESEHRCDKMH